MNLLRSESTNARQGIKTHTRSWLARLLLVAPHPSEWIVEPDWIYPLCNTLHETRFRVYL